ncbi:hypothetical protein N7530_012675 [Penicillium desertorum]|uniref:Uncharacterized protein n=1 Tax=Penicillium desertorum TaxID=1303715 RepID=A0A9W9WDA0_9EURO|nr:hypothetical protein N7530_012675 [Penicillium desertorum]
MSAQDILEKGPSGRSETPPPVPRQMLSLIHRLEELDDDQQLRQLLDHSFSDDWDVRHLSGVMIDAIRSNKIWLVQELLRRNLPMSPIYVLEAVKAKAKDILSTFFAKAWDINKPMGRMDPPLLTNALKDWEMTIWLLDHGADPNVRCDIDYSPLSYAVKYADLPTIDLLLRRGGDVRKGQLVHNAIYRETETLEVVKILIGKGAPFNALMYQDHQASWDMFPFMRETPLHTALALKRDDVVQYLIRKGANVNIENYKGQTVMQCADEDTRRRIVQEIQIRSGLSASL